MIFNHRNSWNVASWIAATYICIFETTIVVVAQNTEVSLGNFTTRMHNVTGEVFLLSERVMEVRGFVYDGQAPAVYFWADTFAVPSAAGFRLNDGSPTKSCGVTPLGQADGTVTYRVEFPNDTFIYKIFGGSISLWCEGARVSFGEVIVPNALSNTPDTANGPELECASLIEEPPVASPTSATLPVPTTTNDTPVLSPTIATAPENSSPVAAPAVSSSAADHNFGHVVTLHALVVTTVTASFLHYTFDRIRNLFF